MATLAAAACTKIDDSVSTTVAPTLTSLALADTVSEADTTARILVTATVKGASGRERPVITFTTSGGGFVADGKVQSTVSALADASHTARALLRPPPGAGLVLIRASVGTSYRQESVRFVVSGLQELRPDRTTVAADGASIVTLRARVSAKAIGSNRQVSFASTGGVLLGAGPAGVVTADTGHVAVAQLQVPRIEGVIYVQATAGGVTIRDSVVLPRAYPESIEVVASQVVVTDQSAAITVSARVSRSIGLVDPRTLVRVSAHKSDGTDFGTSVLPVRVDDDGRVTATLRSTEAGYSGPLRVTATTDGAAGRVLQAQTHVSVHSK